MGDRVNLNSSQIHSAEYDEDGQTMTVHFHSGGSYHYYGVPQEVFEGLRNAESAGKYLHANVKGVYRHGRA